MKNLKVDYVIRNKNANQTEYGLDYEYFDSEKEKNEFIKELKSIDVKKSHCFSFGLFKGFD